MPRSEPSAWMRRFRSSLVSGPVSCSSTKASTTRHAPTHTGRPAADVRQRQPNEVDSSWISGGRAALLALPRHRGSRGCPSSTHRSMPLIDLLEGVGEPSAGACDRRFFSPAAGPGGERDLDGHTADRGRDTAVDRHVAAYVGKGPRTQRCRTGDLECDAGRLSRGGRRPVAADPAEPILQVLLQEAQASTRLDHDQSAAGWSQRAVETPDHPSGEIRNVLSRSLNRVGRMYVKRVSSLIPISGRGARDATAAWVQRDL
jgi:hypothetical protein